MTTPVTSVSLLFSKLERHLVTIDRHVGGGAVVRVFTWPHGPDPVQEAKLPVPSMDDARLHVLPGAVPIPAPAWFTDEAYLYTPEGSA